MFEEYAAQFITSFLLILGTGAFVVVFIAFCRLFSGSKGSDDMARRM